jgi:hypothetical protein
MFRQPALPARLISGLALQAIGFPIPVAARKAFVRIRAQRRLVGIWQ